MLDRITDKVVMLSVSYIFSILNGCRCGPEWLGMWPSRIKLTIVVSFCCRYKHTCTSSIYWVEKRLHFFSWEFLWSWTFPLRVQRKSSLTPWYIHISTLIHRKLFRYHTQWVGIGIYKFAFTSLIFALWWDLNAIPKQLAIASSIEKLCNTTDRMIALFWMILIWVCWPISWGGS